MPAVVAGTDGAGWRVEGSWPDAELANRFLAHLVVRAFAPATVRAYAYDLVNFGRFCVEHGVRVVDAGPADLFDYLEWQRARRAARGGGVVRLAAAGPAPATMNRRIAAVRALFEFAVLAGVRADSPVPSPRRSLGLRAPRHGMLGHVPARHRRRGGRLVRQARRLPESLEPAEVAAFVVDLGTHRDRAMALAMLLGGLRAGEVRGLRLADVDMGLRRVRVVGKGGRERVVPIDRAFFAELAAYLRSERPPGCLTPQCFVVLRGPTAGQAMTEAGMRRVFRTHRARSGATRVRPHRLRHTFGTELAQAGIDLLALRELMGHASPETTAVYVHLSPEALATEYAKARRAAR
jgi:site-specific recombinase XerD